MKMHERGQTRKRGRLLRDVGRSQTQVKCHVRKVDLGGSIHILRQRRSNVLDQGWSRERPLCCGCGPTPIPMTAKSKNALRIQDTYEKFLVPLGSLFL